MQTPTSQRTLWEVRLKCKKKYALLIYRILKQNDNISLISLFDCYSQIPKHLKFLLEKTSKGKEDRR